MRLTVLEWCIGMASLAMVAAALAYKPEGRSDLDVYIEAVKARQPGLIEPLPRLKEQDLSSLEFIRDPFARPISDAETKDTDQPRLRYGMEQSHLVSVDRDTALVLLPDGALYAVQAGDSLWDGGVQVISLKPNEVVIYFQHTDKTQTLRPEARQ